MAVATNYSLNVFKKWENGLERGKSWEHCKGLNLHCVKFILCKLFISPLLACPEWLVPRNLQNLSLAFFLCCILCCLGSVCSGSSFH